MAAALLEGWSREERKALVVGELLFGGAPHAAATLGPASPSAAAAAAAAKGRVDAAGQPMLLDTDAAIAQLLPNRQVLGGRSKDGDRSKRAGGRGCPGAAAPHQARASTAEIPQ
jgi:hypothetical protein